MTDITDHCFREESPTEQCELCGGLASDHSGCDCDDIGSTAREPINRGRQING